MYWNFVYANINIILCIKGIFPSTLNKIKQGHKTFKMNNHRTILVSDCYGLE